MNLRSKSKQTLVIDLEETLISKTDYSCIKLTNIIIDADKNVSKSYIIIDPPQNIITCKKFDCECDS